MTHIHMTHMFSCARVLRFKSKKRAGPKTTPWTYDKKSYVKKPWPSTTNFLRVWVQKS